MSENTSPATENGNQLLPLINLGIALADQLVRLLPKLIAQAHARGELTAEQEADYQRRQAEIWSKDSSQPRPVEPS